MTGELTIPEAAALTGLLERRLRAWCTKGWIRDARRVGARGRGIWLVPRDVLLEAVKERVKDD